MENVNGIVRVDRVVAEYDVWLDAALFPVPKMRVKVLERSDDYVAFSNMARRNSVTRSPDGVAGLGSTADEALIDLLERFVSDVRESTPPEGLTEDDFIWSASEDF